MEETKRLVGILKKYGVVKTVKREKPEFEDLKAIAFKQGCSLKDVRNLLD